MGHAAGWGGSDSPALSCPAVSTAPPLPRRAALRLLSGLLLLGALAGFALGMVTIAFSPLLVSELQQLPGGGLPDACVNGGIATYTGLALVLGVAPSVDTGCLSHLGGDAGAAAVGIQPLAAVAAVLVVGALAATVWGWRWWRPVSLVLTLLAVALLLGDFLGFAGVFEARFGVGADAVAGEPAPGLWVVAGLLVAACLAHAGAATVGWARRALEPIETPRPRMDRRRP
jgi:hypothetical protein